MTEDLGACESGEGDAIFPATDALVNGSDAKWLVDWTFMVSTSAILALSSVSESAGVGDMFVFEISVHQAGSEL